MAYMARSVVLLISYGVTFKYDASLIHELKNGILFSIYGVILIYVFSKITNSLRQLFANS